MQEENVCVCAYSGAPDRTGSVRPKKTGTKPNRFCFLRKKTNRFEPAGQISRKNRTGSNRLVRFQENPEPVRTGLLVSISP